MSDRLNVKTIWCLAITSIAIFFCSEQLFSQQDSTRTGVEVRINVVERASGIKQADSTQKVSKRSWKTGIQGEALPAASDLQEPTEMQQEVKLGISKLEGQTVIQQETYTAVSKPEEPLKPIIFKRKGQAVLKPEGATQIQQEAQHVVPRLEGPTKVEQAPKETSTPHSQPQSLNLVGENLTPYKPSAWSDKIVVSNVTGTTTDAATIYSDQNVYIDWAVVNNGSAPTSTRFYSKLYVDNVEKGNWYTDPPMNVNTWAYVADANIGTLAAGTHTIKIVVDATGVIGESNEADNEYSKSMTIAVRQANLTITSIALNPNPVLMNQTETITVAVRETAEPR